MKRYLALISCLILSLTVLCSCVPQENPTEADDPPIQDPTQTSQELYEEYFAEDRLPNTDLSDTSYGRNLNCPQEGYGTIEVFEKSNPEVIIYTCNYASFGNWMLREDYFYYMDADSTIKKVDLQTLEQTTIYEGNAVSAFSYTSKEIAYFVDGTAIVRLHLQSEIADKIYQVDADLVEYPERPIGITVLTNNAIIVMVKSKDRMLADGSGAYANDYYYIYIPTQEVTPITEQDWFDAIAGEYPKTY